MRKILTILSVLCLSGVSLFSQSAPIAEATNAVESASSTGSPAPGGSAPSTLAKVLDENAVKAEVEAVKAKRKKEEASLRSDLSEAEDNLKGLLAREEQLNREPDKIKQDIADRKARMDETYQVMTDIEGPFRADETRAKDAFVKKLIGELQTKYDAEFDRVMAAHAADMSFVAANRMKPSDFDDLTVSLDAANPARSIRFEGRNGNKVSGSFVTMNYDRGQKVWRQIPDNATFQVTVQKQNPFVTDVLVRFGSDLLACGSTNVLDWDVHVFVGKNFKKKDGDSGKMYFIGVSWPVDLGRPVCWQSGVPLVYDVAPKPVRAIADDTTPEIAKQAGEWVFDDPGELKKKKDAILANETAKRDHQRAIILSENRLARNAKLISDCKDKQKEEQDKIDDIKRKLAEYMEDDPTAEPPVSTNSVPNTGSATNAAMEGLQ